MSTHVVGFIPADAKWNRMKEIYKICEEAAVSIPKEVLDFFGDGDPDEPGHTVELDDAVRDYTSESDQGYELDLKKLPKEVKIIRFYNSY